MICAAQILQAQWQRGKAPERSRFQRLGAAGPPTHEARLLADSLAQGLGCGVCQQLMKSLWEDLARPTATNLREVISKGCPFLVKKHLLRQGWAASSGALCEGAGRRAADGEAWCFLQDTLSESVEHPELAEHYDPAKDSLMLACEDTISYHMERVIFYLTQPGLLHEAQVRNEALMRNVCVEAACCE
ncbi:unnamed protein product [Durusdinium trenchii]|uniref:Saposin B-type domain-containing protein n=1 Tax=Durusdinium trenchii TaxID=1381693 RepID=A0ABP0LQA6_9DINO